MFCKNCGAQCPDNAAFCANCGATFQQAAPQQPMYQQPMQPVTVPGKGLGVASMVLGIISLVLFCIWYVAIPCAIIAVILGGVGASKAKAAGMKNGAATAGIVCSCISLGLTILWVAFIAALWASLF